MTDSSSSEALDRIACAIDRIEAALARAPDAALARRHEALRARVQETIDRLDAMIGPAA